MLNMVTPAVNRAVRCIPLRGYHDDERVDGDVLVVQPLLRQHQDSALGVQPEEAAAAGVQAAVDGEQQPAVGVGVRGADVQDVLPRGRVLGNPHLENTRGGGSRSVQGHEKEETLWKRDTWRSTFSI